MSSIVNANNSVNRLIETLAGSAMLISDPANAGSVLSAPLSPLQSDDGSGASTSAGDNGTHSSVDLTQLIGASDASQLVDDVLGTPVPGATGSGSIISPPLSILDNLQVVGNVLGDTGTGSSPLTLAGSDGTLQPVFDPANALIKDVHAALEVLSHETGTSDLVHAITSLGETAGLGIIGVNHNLVSDVINLPGSIVDGQLDQAIGDISHDLTDVVHAVGNVVDQALFSPNDPTNPIPELISGLGESVSSTALLTINGGNNPNNGGLLEGALIAPSHSDSGHLVDVDVGPQSPNGLAFDVLASPSNGPNQTLEVHAINVGPNGPQLLDLGVLAGGPSAVGADSLVGAVPGLGNVAGASSPIPAATDVAHAADLLPALTAVDHGTLDLHAVHII